MSGSSSVQPFAVGDRIDAVLTREELMVGLKLTRHQFETYRRDRSHPAIVQLDGPGHPRFSGAAVQRWLEQGSPAPARQFFGAATRHRRAG